jgi:hypothetical protein
MRMIREFTGALAVLLVGTSTFPASAGPGDGAVVVVDQPESPDLVIQEVREENLDATHAPVRVRIAIPNVDAAPFRSAHVTGYLTSTLGASDTARLSEVTVKVGPQWANRSLVIDLPSPGEGEYFVHIHGKLRIAGTQDPVEITSTTTQRIRFGAPEDCNDVQDVAIPDSSECPLLFATKSSEVAPATSHGIANQRTLDAAVRVIDDLCTTGSLHRVSVRGWASTTHSDDPPNEVLAQERAQAVMSALQERLSDCRARVHNDSARGTRGVTNQFGPTEANQCAQIRITRHTCSKPDR